MKFLRVLRDAFANGAVTTKNAKPELIVCGIVRDDAQIKLFADPEADRAGAYFPVDGDDADQAAFLHQRNDALRFLFIDHRGFVFFRHARMVERYDVAHVLLVHVRLIVSLKGIGRETAFELIAVALDVPARVLSQARMIFFGAVRQAQHDIFAEIEALERIGKPPHFRLDRLEENDIRLPEPVENIVCKLVDLFAVELDHFIEHALDAAIAPEQKHGVDFHAAPVDIGMRAGTCRMVNAKLLERGKNASVQTNQHENKKQQENENKTKNGQRFSLFGKARCRHLRWVR